jgi:uncharacterized membrane protein
MPDTVSPGSAIEFLKTDNGQRLAIILFSLLATAVMAAFPGSAGAIVLGLPYLFFIPGFALVRLFFWRGTSPEAKLVLSLGLSVLVVIFLALALVFSIGLDQNTTRASMVLFALVAVAFDTFWKRPETKREKSAEESFPKTVKLDKVVAAMLGTALVVSAISLGLIVTADYPSRTYFAVTDENGSADINTTREVNSTMSLILEAKNGEGSRCDFRIVVQTDAWGILLERRNTLNNSEKWDLPVDIALPNPGEFRIDFDLYITEGDSPEYHYGNLHIWIAVA